MSLYLNLEFTIDLLFAGGHPVKMEVSEPSVL